MKYDQRNKKTMKIFIRGNILLKNEALNDAKKVEAFDVSPYK